MRTLHGLALAALLSAGGAAAGQDKGPAEKAKPARTDRHGDALPPGAVARLGTVRLRHPQVSHVVFSPDGKTLASAGGLTARLWDAKTGKELRRLGGGPAALVRSVAFSPDGKWLATTDTGGNGMVRLWETATGKEVRKLSAQGVGRGLAFSPNGLVLLAGGGTTIHRWRMPTGEILPAFTGVAGAQVIAVSRDGTLLATAGQGPRLDLRNPATGEILRQIGDPKGGASYPSSLALFPDGKSVASASGNYPAPRLWDTATGKELRPLGPYGSCVAAAPDGKSVAVGCGEQVRRWDLTTGKELPRLRGHYMGVVSVAYAPDGKTLAAAGTDGVIRLWDLARGKLLIPSAEGAAPIRCVAVSPDGRTLATAGWGPPQLWDRSGRLLRTLALSGTWVDTVAFAPDSKTLATGSHDKLVRLWEVATGKLVREFRGHEKTVAAIAFAPDGKALASSGWDARMRLWDVTTGKEVRQLREAAQNGNLAFSPDGKVLAWCAGTARLSEMDTGDELLRLPVSGGACFLAFSRDGAQVYAGGRGWKTEFACWEASTGKELWRLKLPANEAPTLYALSPDGRTLAAAGQEMVNVEGQAAYFWALRLWEVRAAKVRRRLSGHEGRIEALAFLSDGTLLSAGQDTTALLWEGLRPALGQKQQGSLSAAEVKERWVALAGADAERAYDAVRDLVRSPQVALVFLEKALRPIRAADAKQAAALVRDLASAKYAVREAASKALEDLAEGAEPALRQALRGNLSLETRRRLEQVLEKLDPLKSSRRLRELRAVEVLEGLGSPRARRLLEGLAQGLPQAQLTQEARASLRRLTALAGREGK